MAAPPEKVPKPNKYIRFGFGSERLGVACVFNLNGDTSVTFGAPGINGSVTGKVTEFDDRFTSDQSVKDSMLKYWSVDSPAIKVTLSEPRENSFRAPCKQAEIDIFKKAFENYQAFMIRRIALDPDNSDVQIAEKRQLGRIKAYLRVLNKGPNQQGCIGEHELEKQSMATQTPTKEIWFNVLPKVFYLLYKKGIKGEEDLNMEEIFEQYPMIEQDAQQLLVDLQKEKMFDKHHDGVRSMATSVVELFKLLKILFPEIFNQFVCEKKPGVDASTSTLNPKGVDSGTNGPGAGVDAGVGDDTSKMVNSGTNAPGPGVDVGVGPNDPIREPEDPRAIIKSILDKIPEIDGEIKGCIARALRMAIEHYNKKEIDKVWESLATAFECFNKLILALKGEKEKNVKLNTDINVLLNNLHTFIVSDNFKTIDKDVKPLREHILYKPYYEKNKDKDIAGYILHQKYITELNNKVRAVVDSSELEAFTAATKELQEFVPKLPKDIDVKYIESLPKLIRTSYYIELISTNIENYEELSKLKTTIESDTELSKKESLVKIVNSLLNIKGSNKFKEVIENISKNPTKDNVESEEFKKMVDELEDSEKPTVQNIVNILLSFNNYKGILKAIAAPVDPANPDKWKDIHASIDKLDAESKPDVEAIAKLVESSEQGAGMFDEFKKAVEEDTLEAFKTKLDSLEATDPNKDKFSGIVQKFLDSMDFKKRHSSMTTVIQSIIKTMNDNKGLGVDFKPDLGDIADLDRGIMESLVQAIKDNETDCAPLILSAKKDLYKEMVEYMGTTMKEISTKIQNLKNLLPSTGDNDLSVLLGKELNSEYNEGITGLHKRPAVKDFDAAIKRLTEYLDLLDNKYDQWIKCFCGDDMKWNKEEGKCEEDTSAAAKKAAEEAAAGEAAAKKVAEEAAAKKAAEEAAEEAAKKAAEEAAKKAAEEAAAGEAAKKAAEEAAAGEAAKKAAEEAAAGEAAKKAAEEAATTEAAKKLAEEAAARRAAEQGAAAASASATAAVRKAARANPNVPKQEGINQTIQDETIDFLIKFIGDIQESHASVYTYKGQLSDKIKPIIELSQASMKDFLRTAKQFDNRTIPNIKDYPGTNSEKLLTLLGDLYDYYSTQPNSGGELTKLRKIFLKLYMVAAVYIQSRLGEDSTARANIQAIYDMFNKTYVFDKLFNPLNNLARKKSLQEMFNLHILSIEAVPISFPVFELKAWATGSVLSKNEMWSTDKVDRRIGQLVKENPKKPGKGGSRKEVAFGPDEIMNVLAEQIAWNNSNKIYNSLEPQYQQMLPEPEPAPIHELTEPFHQFMDQYAEEDPLEEARDTLGLMSPADIKDVFTNDNGSIRRVIPLYKEALPNVKDNWILNFIRADALRM